MAKTKAPPAPEFSRAMDVPRAVGRPATMKIAASPSEREGLARRFVLETLDRLEAEVTLERVEGGLVRLAAKLVADVVQSCVATLEPVPSTVSEEFTLLYGDVDSAREIVLAGEEETVEPLDSSSIDIGEAVAQQLSLALDPFPRATPAEE